MASPFAVFRRNQKIMLAVVGIGAMVAFVFLDPLMRYLGGAKGPQNPVVVETRYGAYKESELASIRQARDLVEAFLRATSVETINALVASGNLDARMGNRIAENWYLRSRNELMTRSKAGPEEAALETLILAKKAQQLGMVISDRTINEMLRQLTQDSLTSDSLQSVVNSLHTGRRVSVNRLFDAIRTEMLASKFTQLFLISLNDTPPAQKFAYFSRLNRRAKAEIMPLAVADFTSQVPEPSTETLEKFFDAHKDSLPDAASPEPGFKRPRRAAFQYFKADIATFKEQFKPKVTDDEIRDYYGKNKAQFQALDLPEEPQDKSPDAETPDDAKPQQPDGDAPSEPKSDTATPAKPQEPRPEGSSAVSRPSLRLVSARAVADEQPADEKPADAASAAADDAQDKAAAEAPADKPAEKPAEPSEAAEKPAEEKPAEPKYEPLEKVQEQIRDLVAGQRAGQKIGEIFDELSAQMRRYADEVDIYKSGRESDPKLQPPPPFPFGELAKANGVQAKDLPLVSVVDAAAEDIGGVHRIIRDPRSQFGFRTEPFVEFAFSDSLPTYKPNIVEDNEGNAYLFWKSDEEASYVPTFAQARDTVLAAWKMIEARPLARKRAGELAVQARAADKSLKDVFANQPSLKVIETDWFSWMTSGSVPQDPSSAPPRLSRIEGVEHIGPEFMEVVFGLSDGGVGVAANRPEDTVYVVRLAEYERSIDELRDEFAKERPAVYMAVAGPDQRQIYLAWIAEIERDAQVHWLRPPDTAGRRGGPSPDMPLGDDDF